MVGLAVLWSSFTHRMGSWVYLVYLLVSAAKGYIACLLDTWGCLWAGTAQSPQTYPSADSKMEGTGLHRPGNLCRSHTAAEDL